MTFRIAQSSKPVPEGWWSWAVWLEGEPAELDRVEQVVWRLHSTFAKPVVAVANRATNFRLDSSGWGEFRLWAVVHFKEIDTTEKLAHDLVLSTGGGGPADDAAEAVPEASGKRAPQSGTVFLSYAVGDRDIAERIEREVAENGWLVAGAEPDDPSRLVGPDSPIGTSDAVIVVNSGSSPWVEAECQWAAKLKKPVFEVRIGADTVKPVVHFDGLIQKQVFVQNFERSKLGALDEGLGVAVSKFLKSSDVVGRVEAARESTSFDKPLGGMLGSIG